LISKCVWAVSREYILGEGLQKANFLFTLEQFNTIIT